VTRIGTSLSGALLAVAAPALALAAPASGDAGFDAFAQVCAETHADYPAIVAAADAHGWKATEVTAATMSGVAVTDKLSRGSKVGSVALTLFAWRGTAKGNVQVSACTVRFAKGDSAGVQSAAQAWLGFGAQDISPKKAVFRFTEADGAHHALASTEYDAAAAGTGMEILTVSSDAQGTVVDLLKIKK
jgi:hypothetical protein